MERRGCHRGPPIEVRGGRSPIREGTESERGVGDLVAILRGTVSTNAFGIPGVPEAPPTRDASPPGRSHGPEGETRRHDRQEVCVRTGVGREHDKEARQLSEGRPVAGCVPGALQILKNTGIAAPGPGCEGEPPEGEALTTCVLLQLGGGAPELLGQLRVRDAEAGGPRVEGLGRDHPEVRMEDLCRA